MYQRYYRHKSGSPKTISGKIDIRNQIVFFPNGTTAKPIEIAGTWAPCTEERHLEIIKQNKEASKSEFRSFN